MSGTHADACHGAVICDEEEDEDAGGYVTCMPTRASGAAVHELEGHCAEGNWTASEMWPDAEKVCALGRWPWAWLERGIRIWGCRPSMGPGYSEHGSALAAQETLRRWAGWEADSAG